MSNLERDTLPLAVYGEHGSSRLDTSPKLVSGTVGMYVVNPNGQEDTCRQFRRRNRREETDGPIRGEFEERAVPG